QRVAMGRAIVRQPAVFLFDEPLSNLDAKLRVAMRAEIAKLHRRLGTTTVYVTHDQVEAMTLASHIVVMSMGVVQQVGAPLDLYRRPANTFVGGFIGSPSMNFFDVEVGEGRLFGRGFSIPIPERMKSAIGEHSLLSLGIRPEHMFESPDEENSLPLSVEVLEPLGSVVHALGEVEGQAVTSQLSPDTQVRIGDTVRVGVELEEAHLFERESGSSLL
ncbi:MAG: TOBE domain-containing protein, partial [Myxococcota bacterium]